MTENFAASPKRHKSPRKKCKHPNRSSSSSYSSSPSFSSESSEAGSIEGTLGSQFQVISEKDKFRYSLPTDMDKYANTTFATHVKESDLKRQILMENLVSDNLDQVEKLHDFVRDILKDKCKQKDLDMDVTFEKHK